MFCVCSYNKVIEVKMRKKKKKTNEVYKQSKAITVS